MIISVLYLGMIIKIPTITSYPADIAFRRGNWRVGLIILKVTAVVQSSKSSRPINGATVRRSPFVTYVVDLRCRAE